MGGLLFTVIGHWGAYPGPGEATSCYLLRSQGTSVLLDCGSGALSLLQKTFPLNELDAVILSHYHADHVADLGCLQYAARIDLDLGRRKKPLVVYGHKESPGFEKTRYLDFVEGIAFDKASSVRIGPLTFTFAPMVHPDPSFAIRAECGGSSLVYSGDTGMTPTLAAFAKGTDLLVCETSLYDEYRGKIKGHLSAGEAGELAKAAGAGRLMATHLPHFGTHELLLDQASAAFGGKTLLASGNLELEL